MTRSRAIERDVTVESRLPIDDLSEGGVRLRENIDRARLRSRGRSWINTI